MELISVTEQAGADFVYLTLSIVLGKLAVLIMRDGRARDRSAAQPVIHLRGKKMNQHTPARYRGLKRKGESKMPS